MVNGEEKSMKKKSLIALGMAAMMLCTGCQGGSDKAKTEGGKETEKTVMNIWIAGSGDADADKAYKTVLDAYCEENADVDYQLTYIPWSDYFTKLNTGLAGASGPDIFMLGYGQIGSVQRAGNLLNLSEYLPEDLDVSATVITMLYSNRPTEPFSTEKISLSRTVLQRRSLILRVPKILKNWLKR